MNKTYKFIGKLALSLFVLDIKMSYSTLLSLLKDNEKEFHTYSSERAVASAISAAYRKWEAYENEHNFQAVTSKAIAATFVNKDGYPSWFDY